MQNQTRKYEINCLKNNETVIFSASFYNAHELDNPNRVLLNLDEPIYCSKRNASCTNCTTFNQFINEYKELEK